MEQVILISFLSGLFALMFLNERIRNNPRRSFAKVARNVVFRQTLPQDADALLAEKKHELSEMTAILENQTKALEEIRMTAEQLSKRISYPENKANLNKLVKLIQQVNYYDKEFE